MLNFVCLCYILNNYNLLKLPVKVNSLKKAILRIKLMS